MNAGRLFQAKSRAERNPKWEWKLLRFKEGENVGSNMFSPFYIVDNFFYDKKLKIW